MNSIRRRLLLTLLVSMTFVMLLGAYATYTVAQNEANAIFDYHLRQIALSLRDHRFQLGPPVRIPDEQNLDFVIRIWDRTGVTVYYSQPHRSLPALTQLGYSTVDTPDGKWRVFAIQYLDETIEVAQPLLVRNVHAANAALRTLTPFLVLLPLIGILLWFIIDKGLQPLTRLTKAVIQRTPNSLEPLQENVTTQELQPLVAALNQLLLRLQTALNSQRAFIADAAHELRTPLTALQLQVQLLDRADDTNSRQSAIAELKSGLQRTTHVVQQLLTLARQEPTATERSPVTINLLEIAKQVVVEHQPLADAKQIDLGITDSVTDATVNADADSVRVLLANLVSNAVRYTPVGGKVDVSIGNSDHVYLNVCDNGPGIPPEERERVFDRFYRRPGSDETGSGLGLAIVKRIVERLHANIILSDAAGGGLCARVDFPADSNS